MGRKRDEIYQVAMQGIVSSDMFKDAYKLLSEFEGQVGKMRNDKQNLLQNRLILGLGQLVSLGPPATVSLSLGPSQSSSHQPSLLLSLSLHIIYFPI